MNFLSITWDPSLGIDLGFFTIRWYSLMFVAAFIFGLRIMKKIYIEDKISIEKIRHIISETGYDADKVKANPESVQKLPKCCQPGGMKKH